uniref:Cilia and flagella associated protein 68 n=1 Tax=Latimeria chalumnae TaxID=7897 RepID=H3BHK3_LATCH
FRSMIRASGYAEVWNESNKFNQYGWKCATYEDQYSNDTLIGNWNEERFDIKKLVQRKPLPSQYAHYYQTTYSSAYNKEDRLRPLQIKREPHAFPAHQPELNPPETKKPPNSCQKVDYINPAFHRLPLSPAPKKAEANECKEQGS